MRIVALDVPAELLRVRVRGRRTEPTTGKLRMLAFEALRRMAKPLSDGTGVLTANFEGEFYQGSRINGHAFVWMRAGTEVNEVFRTQFEALARREVARLKRVA